MKPYYKSRLGTALGSSRGRLLTLAALLLMAPLAAGSVTITSRAPAPAESPLLLAQNEPTPKDLPPEEAPEVEPAPGDTGTVLPPDKYYQLLLERQRLSISSSNQILKILAHHQNDPMAALDDLQRHEQERNARIEALFKKYGTSPKEYYRSWRGTKVMEERSDYLDQHPEIRDELVANSKEIDRLDKEVWQRMKPLWNEPAK